MSHQITLYHYWRSSCSWRVRWALAFKGIAYQSQTVNLKQGEQSGPSFISKSPTGLVPCLEVQGKFLSESIAIIEWLEEAYPAKPLLPSSAWDRAVVRELTGIIASDTQPVQNLRVMLRHSSDQQQRQDWARWAIENGLQAFEAKISKTAGTFSVGSQLTVADICLIPQVYNAIRFNVDMNQFPHCHRIYQSSLKLPHCDQAAPHNQPGATP